MIESKYLYVYASNFPVKGFTRTMLVDTARKTLYFIDNTYYDLFEEFRNRKIDEIYQMMEDDFDRQEFEKFISYLISNELATIVDEIECFPPMPIYWDSPCIINNAIIDVGKNLHDFDKIFKELNLLGCRHLQIRAYHTLALQEIEEILDLYETNDFRSIEIYTKFQNGLTSFAQLEKIQKKYQYLSLVVHSAPMDELIINTPSPELPLWKLGSILFLQQHITSCDACGIINQKSFYAPTLELFSENQLFNGCLNRKISIDVEGGIKNCPSMVKSYGNITEQSLTQVALMENFQFVWGINKNKIKVCQDCEYRAVCTDCRAYLDNPADMFSKPLKCNYDPYSGVWQDTVLLAVENIVQ